MEDELVFIDIKYLVQFFGGMWKEILLIYLLKLIGVGFFPPLTVAQTEKSFSFILTNREHTGVSLGPTQVTAKLQACFSAQELTKHERQGWQITTISVHRQSQKGEEEGMA